MCRQGWKNMLCSDSWTIDSSRGSLKHSRSAYSVFLEEVDCPSLVRLEEGNCSKRPTAASNVIEGTCDTESSCYPTSESQQKASTWPMRPDATVLMMKHEAYYCNFDMIMAWHNLSQLTMRWDKIPFFPRTRLVRWAKTIDTITSSSRMYSVQLNSWKSHKMPKQYIWKEDWLRTYPSVITVTIPEWWSQ